MPQAPCAEWTYLLGMRSIVPTIALGLALLGCSDDESTLDAALPATPGANPAAVHDVQIAFAAHAGGTDVQCGEVVELGEPATSFAISDLRFFVHDVRLLDVDGAEVPVSLVPDGRWQLPEVALLDFEDGCEAGNADLNATLVGAVDQPGPFTGVRFRLGVPFELNHADAATAPSPLNLTAMFWNWNGGYKFLRLDGTGPEVEGWRFHLGSTQCVGDAEGQVERCGAPNRPDVELLGDPTEGMIVFDVDALLAGVDLTSNTPDTAPGCMSSPDDPECGPLFDHLGLAFGEGAGDQRVFHLGAP